MSDTTRMSQAIVGKTFQTITEGTDKTEVIKQLAESLVTAGKISEDKLEAIIAGALERETLGSTGIGHGIAIPHCRTDLADEIICAYGTCAEGIDFASIDDEPVYCVFFLVSPPTQTDNHRELMKSFAGMIRSENFSDFLKECDNPKSLVALLKEFENK